MSIIPAALSVLLSALVPMAPGFLLAYVLRFRSRTWGSIVLSAGMALAVIGWVAAFSWVGLALLVVGVTLFGAGLEGVALAGRRSRQDGAA